MTIMHDCQHGRINCNLCEWYDAERDPEQHRRARLKGTKTFVVTLPVPDDDLGKWMENHGAGINIQCILGTYHVTVGWCELVSSSDERGTHRKTWEVSRYRPKLPEAISEALDEAMRQTKGGT